MRLVVDDRLKNAPTYHLWNIGNHKRAILNGLQTALTGFTTEHVPLTPAEKHAQQTLKALHADVEVNPYTEAMREHDRTLQQRPNFNVGYSLKDGQFRLHDTQSFHQQLQAAFHPIEWPEFRDDTLFSLLCAAVPPMITSRITLETYQTGRWLYDETAQRAAEALTERTLRTPIPATMNVTDTEQTFFLEYEARLKRETNPRRWYQEKWQHQKRTTRATT